ncbi:MULTISPECIES: mechanosensitive ion channel family protein [Cellulophaga]|jgi:small conductance mechanosensitive channel|uniref:Small conductance mechanosensitive channel n=2 Tax=Cellulophaga baltica TaxID=76594 RepID=A0A1G7CWQ9_9FLAO|nr:MULTISPECIES: mechanosensitive ion channel family protein [Cellulophaga]WFO18064.1 mechanosensitive ion channel family protein [Cellulophaga baltica 4]AIY13118.1 mechanosensitive ion channel protein [Cellulophaga baltica NN016038]AIZ41487.1 mechanosensitive ion channel protein [Cellulophaga baltica 18]KGK31877.1 mechanosensitive ion channel protein [Cellulophaga sp. E6(2014)]MBA6313331.1 mechanosensitive ion channel family protein [Cellulophaga baltica]
MEKLTDYQEHIDNAINWIWAALPNLILAILIFIIGLWLIKVINKMVRKFFVKHDYDPSLESFLQSLISIGLKITLFVLVITQLGVQSSSLVAIIGAAGLAIGLALQGSLANFAGGVLILIFKPFKVGDFIAAQGVDGTVKEISIFTTKLSTFGNQIVIVPNGQLSNNNITNYNAQDTRRDKISIGIGYSSDLKKAKDVLLKICADNETIFKDPAPVVYVDELADSSVNLTLRFWANNADFWEAHFFVMEQTKLRFDEEGIEIPFPQVVQYNK